MKYILALLIIGLFVTGCTQSATEQQAIETKDNGATTGSASDAKDAAGDSGAKAAGSNVKESIKSLFSKGMGLKCTYKAEVADADGNMVDATATYYVKGKKANIEYSTNEGTWKVIMNETAVAMDAKGQGTQTGDTTDCDWLIFSIDQSSQDAPDIQEELSVEEYNAQSHEGYVDFKCVPSVIDDKMFAVSGKVCDLAAMMGAALGTVPTGADAYEDVPLEVQ